jgi:N-acetylmuramoyl-L-alanine amidase
MKLYSWRLFVHSVSNQQIERSLKVVQLSQAILESGRGRSFLFRNYGNPFGMKYRNEMSAIATPVEVSVSDGIDTYCRFDSEVDAVKGYWIFLNRRIYDGWQDRILSPNEMIRFLLSRGYAGTDIEKQEDYYEKICRIFPEVSHLIEVL